MDGENLTHHDLRRDVPLLGDMTDQTTGGGSTCKAYMLSGMWLYITDRDHVSS